MPTGVSASTDLGLLVGTRKGAFILTGGRLRRRWTLQPPIFLGHIIYHFVCDPRDHRVMLMAAKAGHLGPTVFRSSDRGRSWTEAEVPPAFRKAAAGETGKAVDLVFWLTPGHAGEPGVWYAGTSPPGLFRSEDHGRTWEPVSGLNDNPRYTQWTEVGATPGGHFLHSIIVHPQNPRHMYIGISVGGVFESHDGGSDWSPLNRGCAADFLPDPSVEYGHDPHCLVLHPLKPERLYQQNHCGIYRIDRPANEWTRIGENMPKDVGDIGFPIVTSPRDPDRAWVFPMDGTEVWPRTSPGGKPATYMTRDGGRTWKRQDAGLPRADAYFTVKRQAMCSDTQEPLGLYFGTSQGEIWASADEGESWRCIVRHLPEIYSLSVVESGR